jgi:Protein of unknown function (DUF3987)
MTGVTVDGVTFDPAFLDQVEQVSQRGKEARQANFAEQLAQAERAGGGAYAGDAPVQQIANGALSFPPGFVGAVAQFIYQQAPRPVVEVAIVGALGLMAGIAGREWYIPGSGLNLYVVLIAKSGVGKEAMHSGIDNIVAAASVHFAEARLVVNRNDFASGAALLKGCLGHPCMVNVAGEIGHKFLAMAQTNDPSMRSLRKQLTTLYSKSGPTSIAGGISYSSQENNVEAVQSVAFSLIGETTPGTFYESITDTMMRDGFMSRFCVVEYTGDRPDKNPAILVRPPEVIIDHMVPIMRHASLLRATEQYLPVAFADSAAVLLDRFEAECDAGVRAAGEDESLRQLWNRAHLKALRVAALLAVGDHYLCPTVTDDHATWAVALVRHGIEAFLKRIRAGDVGEGTDGGREQKVLELCKEFIRLTPDKMPTWLKGGEQMRQAGIVPRKFLQLRTQRLAAFERHKLGHTAALNMAIKTAVTNGNLMDVKGDKLVEQFGFHGQAYRVLSVT